MHGDCNRLCLRVSALPIGRTVKVVTRTSQELTKRRAAETSAVELGWRSCPEHGTGRNPQKPIFCTEHPASCPCLCYLIRPFYVKLPNFQSYQGWSMEY